MSPESFDSENGLPEQGNSKSASQTSHLKVETFSYRSNYHQFVFLFFLWLVGVIKLCDRKLICLHKNHPYFIVLLG
jgi:hypothetical protein